MSVPMRVLVAPLDWGLGHATRCIPIIHALLARGASVMIGSSGDALAVLRAEFPFLPYETLTPYRPYYSASSAMVWAMARQLRKFVRTIQAEHIQTEQLVARERIDLIISDNRYGCWSAHARSIFITHQVNILMPPAMRWCAPVIHYFNKRQRRHFSTCWVPDWPPPHSLAGKLSLTRGEPLLRYIGPLSRLAPTDEDVPKRYALVAVLSGPEPQRSLLENILRPQLQNFPGETLLVRGVPGLETRQHEGTLTVVDYMSAQALQTVLQQAAMVVCRSGYSSVMDLARMGGQALFIPTPGQTEQWYLARRLHHQGVAYYVKQQQLNLLKDVPAARQMAGFTKPVPFDEQLTRALDECWMVQYGQHTSAVVDWHSSSSDE